MRFLSKSKYQIQFAHRREHPTLGKSRDPLQHFQRLATLSKTIGFPLSFFLHMASKNNNLTGYKQSSGKLAFAFSQKTITFYFICSLSTRSSFFLLCPHEVSQKAGEPANQVRTHIETSKQMETSLSNTEMGYQDFFPSMSSVSYPFKVQHVK